MPGYRSTREWESIINLGLVALSTDTCLETAFESLVPRRPLDRSP